MAHRTAERSPNSRLGIALALASVVAVGTFGCEASTPRRFSRWRAERASRQAAIDAYLASDPTGVSAFLYAPLGDFGIPLETFRAFPRAMPDVFGPESERLDAIGLGVDRFDPSNALPLGIGTFESHGVPMINLTCGGCHVGRVIGPDGRERLLFGAPNTRFNAVFTAFEDAALDARWDSLGGDIDGVVAGVSLRTRRDIEERTIGAYTFDRLRTPNAPDYFARRQPGFFDSFATIFAMQTIPDSFFAGTEPLLQSIMPTAPGEADIMSVFMQSTRPAAEWDGSLPHPVYRNLAAAVGAVGFGSIANFDAANGAARLTSHLPPPPYPFDVDDDRRVRGEALFDRHCASCHHEGSTTVFPPAFVGTDPNRASSVTIEGRARLIATLREACTDSSVCDVPDDRIVADVSASVRGYLALPLHGIWARAPYLHNGSVPTLRQLLVPSERPERFIRGSLRYDGEAVGFAWDASAASDAYVHEYDTTLAGRSNRGHEGSIFLGRDWEAEPDALLDLLEYLKTL